MKNQFIAISDVHISLKNLEISLQVLTQALEKARELKVPLVIAGDLNDTKAVMRSEWVSALISLFEEYHDVDIEIIDGNHDLNNKASAESSLQFLKLIPNVCVYHEPVHYGDWYFIPYCNTQEQFLEAIDYARDKGIKKLVCHQGFKGAFMGDYVVDESSVDPKKLASFDLILSGHYHKHQWVQDNLMYFGSPFTVNFGEAGQEKFIWQIYEAEGKTHTQPIMTDARKHVQIVLEPGYESNLACEEFLSLREQDLLKVVMKGPKEFALSQPKLSCPTKNITLVPDIDRQSTERIEKEIIHQPIKVLEKYLEGAHTEYDKEVLKNHLWPIIGDILNSLSNAGTTQNKVVKVIARNFLSYKDLEYNYLSKGLTLIEGHDEDHDISTGAGKSSFLDVVSYGLFGKTSKKLKADEVVNRQAKKNTFVQIELETPDGTLLVTRYRKDSEYDNDLSFAYAGQSEATRGKDNVDTQSLLEKELGMDLEMFLVSSYFTQFGSIDKFLSAPDQEKKKLISEISDTGIYDKMVEAIKEHIKNTGKALDEAASASIGASSKYDTLLSSQNDVEASIEDWNQQQEIRIAGLEEQVDSWENNKQEELKDLLVISAGFENSKKDLIKQAQEESEQWDTQEAQALKSIGDNIDTKEKELDVAKVKSQPPALPEYEAEKVGINNKLSIIKNLESEVLKMDFDIEAKVEKVKELEGNILQTQGVELETNCDWCHQPISKEQAQKKAKEYQVQIDVVELEIKILRTKKSDIVKSTKVKESLEKRLVDINVIETEYQVKLSQSEDAKRRISSLAKDINELRHGIDHRPGNPHLNKAQQISSQANPYIGQISSKEQEVNPVMQSLDEAKKATNPHIELKDKNTLKLEEALQARDKVASDVLSLEKDIDLSKWWREAINVYIKSYLTDSFIEQINTLANEYLQQMFDGILSINISATNDSGKVSKEKITVTIYNKNEECSYNSLSGGERCRICFALNLAIRKVTNINMGFLMFDEVLNGLDDVGKSQAMRVFKELEAEYETIFVIDHTTEFKSLFTNNIMVRKSNGVSSVVE